MNKLLLSAALAGVLTAGVAMQAQATEKKDKCYGIAKAGKNDCAAADGSHSCAGQAKTDGSKEDWAYVAAGECEKAGGSLKAGKNACKH